MKKSLLALAVFGAFAGAASAQSSVTLFGIVDMGFVNAGGASGGIQGVKSVSTLSSGVMSGSRLGVRGVEDLGGGLKARFTAETGFCADTNAGGFCTGGGSFMGRQAFVALEGGFGTISMGRQYHFQFEQLNAADPFGTGLAGNSGNLINTFGVRTNNSFKYVSPDMGGFRGGFLYGFDEVANSYAAAGTRVVQLSGNYAQGPLYVGLVYTNAQARTVAGTSVASGNKIRNINLTASYDFGVAKLYGMYAQNRARNAAGATLVGTGLSDANDSKQWLLGVTAPVAGGTVHASYIRNNNTDSATVTNNNASQFALGYTMPLSRRTNIYTSFGKISNQTGATFVTGNATDAFRATRQFNVGVRHLF